MFVLRIEPLPHRGGRREIGRLTGDQHGLALGGIAVTNSIRSVIAAGQANITNGSLERMVLVVGAVELGF